MQTPPTCPARREQRLPVEPMAVGVWAGQPRLGGLSVAETEARRLGIAVMQDRAKRGRHATGVPRSHKAPKAAAAQ